MSSDCPGTESDQKGHQLKKSESYYRREKGRIAEGVNTQKS